MAKAIAFQDKSFLVGVSGLGPKLVARLLTELKEKDLPVYARGAISSSASSVANASLKNEAISALCNLGVSKSESLSIVTKLLIENPDISINELIKQGLKNLNKNSQ
jgi:Holliday junction DNA helicase RuvA